MADVCLQKKRKPKFTRCRRRPAGRRDMAPTQGQLAAIERAVIKTAGSFGVRLSAECIEDLVQEVFLGLWKSRAEHLLICLPYLRRVAGNVTIEWLRRQSAQKRNPRRVARVDLERLLSARPRTAEEALIEREEALRLLETDPGLKRRVRYAMKQYEKAQSRTAA